MKYVFYNYNTKKGKVFLNKRKLQEFIADKIESTEFLTEEEEKIKSKILFTFNVTVSEMQKVTALPFEIRNMKGDRVR